jgi:hypothetical protein
MLPPCEEGHGMISSRWSGTRTSRDRPGNASGKASVRKYWNTSIRSLARVERPEFIETVTPLGGWQVDGILLLMDNGLEARI